MTTASSAGDIEAFVARARQHALGDVLYLGGSRLAGFTAPKHVRIAEVGIPA